MLELSVFLPSALRNDFAFVCAPHFFRLFSDPRLSLLAREQGLESFAKGSYVHNRQCTADSVSAMGFKKEGNATDIFSRAGSRVGMNSKFLRSVLSVSFSPSLPPFPTVFLFPFRVLVLEMGWEESKPGTGGVETKLRGENERHKEREKRE